MRRRWWRTRDLRKPEAGCDTGRDSWLIQIAAVSRPKLRSYSAQVESLWCVESPKPIANGDSRLVTVTGSSLKGCYRQGYTSSVPS